MAKNDFRATDIKDSYKLKVRSQSLTKVDVSSDEKRARAELLDIIEEIFQSTGEGDITAQSLRAFCHILVKSVSNTTDDDASVSLDNTTTVSNLPTRAPRNAGFLWNDGGTIKVS